jgi:hypothetical protein
MNCPTCGSTDVDILLPVDGLYLGKRICDDPWHEDRIEVRKSTSKSGEAASRQPSWPAGFTASYVAGYSKYSQRATEAAIRSVNEMAKNMRNRDEGKI